MGRVKVYTEMAQGHAYHDDFNTFWGNTQWFAQCAGIASSDGNVLWMPV